MTAAQTLHLTPTFSSYQLKDCSFVLVFVNEFTRGLCHLET